MSAPSSSGFCSAAVAIVLSTNNGTPWACATPATAATSVTNRHGLLGVSTHTSRVRASICSSQARGSAGSSTNRNTTLQCSGKIVAACLYPSPKTFRLVTTLSPGRASVKIRLNSACEPEPAVTAPSPPSSEASRSSNMLTVGVLLRP
jgi:hypothetical protein